MSKREGPSEAGFHFIQHFRNCERYFYHQYIDNIEPLQRSPALLFGGAMHKALEVWYNLLSEGEPVHKRAAKAQNEFEKAMKAVQHMYEYEDAFFGDLDKGKRNLQEYGLQYSNEYWKVEAVENDLKVTFDTGDVFTGRLDFVGVDGYNKRYIVDHKFSGWSLSNFKRSLDASDQATAYKLLWEENFPDKPLDGIIFNIVRNYKNDINFDQHFAFRSQSDVEDFRRGIRADLARLSEKLANPDAAWPKNTDQCFKYNRPCPFLDICKGMKNWQALIGIKYKYRDTGEVEGELARDEN